MPQGFGNRFVVAILRSPLHAVLGPDFALIEVTGRRTKRTITLPVNAYPEAGTYLILSRRERIWWQNLRDRPGVGFRSHGIARPMQSQLIEEPREVAQLLREHLRRRPSHARYLGLSLGADGQVDEKQLESAAQERVFIRLLPS